MKYYKVQDCVKALQYTGDNVQECLNFLGDYAIYLKTKNELYVPTLEGKEKLKNGDYIILECCNSYRVSFSVLDKESFNKMYKPVN